tara:strand:- start:137 stop:502 length:366 start_codon:yes stop_codon:yes gene_type:complete
MIDCYIQDNSPKNILETRDVDRPILQKFKDYIYTGLDLVDRPNCHKINDTFLVQSIDESLDQKFVLIISKTLFEHVTDNTKSLNVMYDSLHSYGIMTHHLPCKYHIYSIILKIIGQSYKKS